MKGHLPQSNLPSLITVYARPNPKEINGNSSSLTLGLPLHSVVSMTELLGTSKETHIRFLLQNVRSKMEGHPGYHYRTLCNPTEKILKQEENFCCMFICLMLTLRTVSHCFLISLFFFNDHY